MPILSSLFIYPIKSLAGFAVNQWPVVATGFQYDRQWMLVDEQRQFLSQRRLPQMALLQTRIQAQQLIVSAPQQDDLILELNPKTNVSTTITVWHDSYEAQLISEAANQWFSQALNTPCQLVYQPTNTIRQVDPNYANPEDNTAFSDGFPFLITTEASLALLNQQMSLNLSMQRFRPNLVISDCESYAEDTWRELQIAHINFRLPKPCSRCSVPQINPKTALNDKEPLRTLSRTRQYNNKVYFGQNALHDTVGLLNTGDEVLIMKTGASQPPLKNDNLAPF